MQVCPGFPNALSDGSMNCVPCPKGETSNSTAYISCKPGEYKTGSLNRVPGSFNNRPGATSIAECICVPRPNDERDEKCFCACLVSLVHTKILKESRCQPCPTGTFSDEPGSLCKPDWTQASVAKTMNISTTTMPIETTIRAKGVRGACVGAITVEGMWPNWLVENA